ncbi:uncharacterized protein L203_100210 [Cryptococcus depauperatus CBS 7841]|uniref:Mtf2-like C-terminal domain-containing protein n=1 Tax=Cryptococcus depauperatus CBS 7841 TaxID=1295531 RepID=A0AAJ8JML7_9TREE
MRQLFSCSLRYISRRPKPWFRRLETDQILRRSASDTSDIRKRDSTHEEPPENASLNNHLKTEAEKEQPPVDREDSHFDRLSQPASLTNKKEGDAEEVHFNQLLSALEEEWPKQPNYGTHPRSITSRLSFSSNPASSRAMRGPQGRFRRAGMTPPEATVFNELISSLLVNSPLSNSPSSDPYSAAKSGGTGFGLQGWNRDEAKRLRPIFNRDKDEDANIEELEMLTEEMSLMGSDLELLEWAKNRVLKPEPPKSAQAVPGASITQSFTASPKLNTIRTPDVLQAEPLPMTAPSTTQVSPTDLPPLLNFSPVYPTVLARVLKTLRENFNSPYLVFAVFQHAQTSSIESYLSGCSTGAYNEVLTCRWDSFKDLEGVQRGVREMEMMGVKWDKDTNRLIGRIIEEVGRAILQGSGRWGEDVLLTLRQLEEKVEKDVIEEERYHRFEQQSRERAKQRREREAISNVLISRTVADHGAIGSIALYLL